jgi:hypothetical protein
MHRQFIILLILLSGIMSHASVRAQAPVWHQGIEQLRLNVRGNPVVVGELTIDVPEAGYVLAHFDGQCYVSPGDLIILAASNTTDWEVNDGNISIESVDSDINICSFSHSRLYPVDTGENTFYAIAHNFVETDGSGIIDLFANLTVTYFAESGEVRVWAVGINETRINVRGEVVTLAKQDVTVPVSGNILVRFDGLGYTDVGDRIVFAASDTAEWFANDGCNDIEAVNDDIDNMSFSHSRMYKVGPGQHSFYAVAENWVETEGNGKTSVYGNLSIEFFPDENEFAQVKHQGIVENDINVRDSVVTLATLNITTSRPGKAVVHFDGRCLADVGDRIVLAASDDPNWEVNAGGVGIEVPNEDQNRRPFSHTRVYEIDAGSHDFYAVVQNYVETDGSGIVSVYGNFSVEFFADPNSTGLYTQDNILMDFRLNQNYPNPFNPTTNIVFDLPEKSHVQLDIYNMLGERVTRLVDEALSAGSYRYTWQAQGLASGVYYYQVTAGEFRDVKKMFLLR